MDGIEPQDDSYSIKLEKEVVDTEYENVPTNPTRAEWVTGRWTGQPRMLRNGDYITLSCSDGQSSTVYDCTTRKTLYSKKYHYIGINLGGNPIPKNETKTFLVKNK